LTRYRFVMNFRDYVPGEIIHQAHLKSGGSQEDQMEPQIKNNEPKQEVRTTTKETAIWGGQQVLPIHLKYIQKADITHGHHCGYISPIPYVEFNDTMAEGDFRSFIEAISNDIINWDNVTLHKKLYE